MHVSKAMLISHLRVMGHETYEHSKCPILEFVIDSPLAKHFNCLQSSLNPCIGNVGIIADDRRLNTEKPSRTFVVARREQLFKLFVVTLLPILLPHHLPPNIALLRSDTSTTIVNFHHIHMSYNADRHRLSFAEKQDNILISAKISHSSLRIQ